MDTIGARLRSARKRKGLTQTDIYKLAGISSGNLSDIENDKQLPSSTALISLSREFEVSIDWILTGMDYKAEEGSILQIAEDFVKKFDPSDIEHLAKLHKLTSENKLKVEGFIEALLLNQIDESKQSKQAKLSGSTNSNGREESVSRAEGA